VSEQDEHEMTGDLAEDAWREHAETVHRFLRRRESIADPDGRAALVAFERIGDGIALQHKRNAP